MNTAIERPTLSRSIAEHVTPAVVLTVAGAALVYCRVLVEVRFNRTVALALLQDTRPDAILATLMHTAAYIAAPVAAGVAVALWQKARREQRYSEASVVLFLLAAALAVAFLPATAVAVVVGLPVAWHRLGRLDGDVTKPTLRSAVVDGVLAFGAVCLVMASGMWLPLERVSTSDGVVVGYVVRQSPSPVVLRDGDRMLVHVDAISARTPCRRPPRPGAVLQRSIADFVGLGADLPRCSG